MSLEIRPWKLQKKSQFSYIAWPNLHTFKYLLLKGRLPLGDFTYPNLQSFLHLLSLTPSLPAFFEDLSAGQKCLFRYNPLCLMITLRKYVLTCVIFSTTFFVGQWSLQSSFDLVSFGLVLWHISHCRSFNAKSILHKIQFYFKQFSLV